MFIVDMKFVAKRQSKRPITVDTERIPIHYTERIPQTFRIFFSIDKNLL